MTDWLHWGASSGNALLGKLEIRSKRVLAWEGGWDLRKSLYLRNSLIGSANVLRIR